jgi:hypothetical protein
MSFAAPLPRVTPASRIFTTAPTLSLLHAPSARQHRADESVFQPKILVLCTVCDTVVRYRRLPGCTLVRACMESDSSCANGRLDFMNIR